MTSLTSPLSVENQCTDSPIEALDSLEIPPRAVSPANTPPLSGDALLRPLFCRVIDAGGRIPLTQGIGVLDLGTETSIPMTVFFPAEQSLEPVVADLLPGQADSISVSYEQTARENARELAHQSVMALTDYGLTPIEAVILVLNVIIRRDLSHVTSLLPSRPRRDTHLVESTRERSWEAAWTLAGLESDGRHEQASRAAALYEESPPSEAVLSATPTTLQQLLGRLAADVTLPSIQQNLEIVDIDLRIDLSLSLSVVSERTDLSTKG